MSTIKQTCVDYYGSSAFVKYAGSGDKTIIFIHGNSVSSETWEPQLNAAVLNKKYKLFAIDLPGCGESQWIQGDVTGYEPKKLGRIIKLLLQKFNIEKYILVGLSYGTNIIGEIAPVLPGCKGIVLASPCIVNEDFPASEILFPVTNGHVMTAFNPSDEEIKTFVLSIVNKEKIADAFCVSYRKTDPVFREQLGKALFEGTLDDELKNIKNWQVPVCIVYGENENIIKTTYLQNFSPLWQNQIFLIKDAGHVLNEENPEAFNELLASYAEDVFK